MADIVVPPPTPPPRTVSPYMTVGVLPFVTLAVVAIIVLWFARKARSLKSSAAPLATSTVIDRRYSCPPGKT
ncbi:hypothetical protein EV701_102311 [Chthoniobacter flavus]|nr:hypothetical protein EV701_102311 [Chthoniobacter flavus]